jgi:hypothetical protein
MQRTQYRLSNANNTIQAEQVIFRIMYVFLCVYVTIKESKSFVCLCVCVYVCVCVCEREREREIYSSHMCLSIFRILLFHYFWFFEIMI